MKLRLHKVLGEQMGMSWMLRHMNAEGWHITSEGLEWGCV